MIIFMPKVSLIWPAGAYSIWFLHLFDMCLSFSVIFLTFWYKKVFQNHLIIFLFQSSKWPFFPKKASFFLLENGI